MQRVHDIFGGSVRSHWWIYMTHMMLLQPHPNLTGRKQLDIWRDVSEGHLFVCLFIYSGFENEKEREKGRINSWTLALWPSRMFKGNQKILRQQTSKKKTTKKNMTTAMTTALAWEPQGQRHGSEAEEEGRRRKKNSSLPDLAESILAHTRTHTSKKEPKSNTFINLTKTFSQFHSAGSVIALKLWLIFININYKCQNISSAPPTCP